MSLLENVDPMGSGSLEGALDDLTRSYRYSAEQDMDMECELDFIEPQYDAVVRLDVRPPDSDYRPQQAPAAAPIADKKGDWLGSFLRAYAPPDVKASKDGGASMIALMAAAARHLGVQMNPVEAELAMQAQRDAELRAQAAQADAAQDAKCKEGAARRVVRREAAAAAARAAGASIPNFARSRAASASATPQFLGPTIVTSSPTPAVAGPLTCATGQPFAFALVPPAPPGTAQQGALRASQLAALSSAAEQSPAPAVPVRPAAAAQRPSEQQDLPPVLLPAAQQAAQGGKNSSKQAPAAAAAPAGSGSSKPAAGASAAASGSGGKSGGKAGARTATEAKEGSDAAVRQAKRLRQATEDRRMWSISVAFTDAKTSHAVHHKLDGGRFKGAKIPATLKFGFGREYLLRVTADSSLNLGANAHVVTRSPEFFEHVIDQAEATPYLEDDNVALKKVVPPLASPAVAAAPSIGAAAGAAAEPKAAPKAAAAAAAATSVASSPAPPQPSKDYQQASRTTWEGKWRCMSEPVAKTQRVALRLSLRLEGLGSVELPLMAKIYEAGILHSDAGAAAAAHGQPLQHVAFAVERNPWSELMEVARATYVAAPPAAH